MTDSLLTETPVSGEPKNYYAELVGDNKKFKDNESLAKGKWESDSYIKILESRLDERDKDYRRLQEDYQSRAKLEELIDQLSSMQKQPTSSNEYRIANDDVKPTFDPKELESLVSNKIQEHESNRRHQDNYNQVRSKLQEHFGDNYQSIVKKQIAELDLTEDDVNQLARSNPKLLLKTLGVGEQRQTETFQAPPRSDRRTDNFAPTGAKKRTWAYYQQMRKDDPTLYNNPKTATQMHKDYIELGAEFEDGDFHQRWA